MSAADQNIQCWGGKKKREKQGFVLNFPDKDNEI